jgi:glycosyltransferase involved in cell wall biosynthesis
VSISLIVGPAGYIPELSGLQHHPADKQLRILIIKNIFSDSASGGAELLCHNIASSLSERGHELFVLAARPGSRSNRFKVAGKLMRVKPTDSMIKLISFRKKFAWILCSLYNYHITRRYINKIKPDVIYLHNIEWLTSSPLSAAADSGIRLVIHLHNHHYHELWKSSRGNSLRKGMRAIFHLSARFGNARLIAVSKTIAREFLDSGYKNENIVTIHNGLPEAVFGRAFSGVERKNILFVGEIAPHKGIEVAIDAIGVLRDQGISCNLDIIGSSQNKTYRANIGTMIERRSLAGQVRFLGTLPREEVWDQMHGAGIILLPAVGPEAFGLVVAEAMACGAYPIVSNRGALPEVIGDCGSLVEPTPHACAEAIRHYLTLPCRRKDSLRLAGMTRARELFSLENNMAEIERALT